MLVKIQLFVTAKSDQDPDPQWGKNLVPDPHWYRCGSTKLLFLSHFGVIIKLFLVRKQLRGEFPGVYAWNSSASPGQPWTELCEAGTAVQFAVALLAQEHLQGWNCFQARPLDGRLSVHMEKLRLLCQERRYYCNWRFTFVFMWIF